MQIIRETTPESGDILIHHEQTVQMLREVASGQREATLRMYQPNPTVAFGRRDELNPGFADAVAACEEHGFRTLVRKVGGHAAAYHRGCLVVDHFQPATDARSGNTVRYRLFGSMFAQALREVGVDARVGEIPGSTAPASTRCTRSFPNPPAAGASSWSARPSAW